MFVFQHGSRREANREMTRPAFWEVFQQIFPEIDSIPHADTLERVLERIAPEELEQTLLHIVGRLLRKRKLQAFLVERCYVVAVDGTQKFSRDYAFAPEALHRRTGPGDHLIFGIRVGSSVGWAARDQPAFARRVLRKSPWQSGADETGLRVEGVPEVMQTPEEGIPETSYSVGCRWFVSQWTCHGAMPLTALGFHDCVARGVSALGVGGDTGITAFGANTSSSTTNGKTENKPSGGSMKSPTTLWMRVGATDACEVHAAGCTEKWVESGKEQKADWIWVSGGPLMAKNIVNRCNRAARHRWGIEEHFLIEKHHGYQCEHDFSRNWNALK